MTNDPKPAAAADPQGLRMARAHALMQAVMPLAADEAWKDAELREIIWATAADEYERSRAALAASPAEPMLTENGNSIIAAMPLGVGRMVYVEMPRDASAEEVGRISALLTRCITAPPSAVVEAAAEVVGPTMEAHEEWTPWEVWAKFRSLP